MNETRATRLCMKNRVSSFNRNNVEVDRIGSLPDEILTHILTFLSTKESLQTCVLSKRWKNTWAAVPILEIKLKDFLIDNWSGGSDEERRIAVARFERFMTGFLDNRAPTNLERVHYVCDFGFGQPDTSIGWLERVMLLMPLQIHISISYWSDNSLDVPDLTFSCASLQHLSISLYSEVKTIIQPVSINLPSLTCLELNHVDFPDDFSQKIFMGCPSLERLKLCFCDLYFSSISSEMLKELTLHGGHICEQMQISCPNLVSLFMTTSLKRGGISLKNMSSLVNVDIKLYLYFADDVPVLNLFGGLSNAAKLKLYLGTPVLTEQLKKDVTNCRNFNNLMKLVVGGRWDQTDNFKLIACLLKHSSNLKKLSLLVNESYYEIQAPRQEVSGDVLFQCDYLETVKISPEFGGELSCLSSKLINSMIKTLGTYVKKIGNLIIA